MESRCGRLRFENQVSTEYLSYTNTAACSRCRRDIARHKNPEICDAFVLFELKRYLSALYGKDIVAILCLVSIS